VRAVPSARRLLLSAATALLLVPAATASAQAGSPCQGAGAAVTPEKIAQARATVRCLLNQERARAGVRRLRPDRRLRVAATRHSQGMVARTYFDHDGPAGGTLVTRVTRTGYINPRVGWTIGENIGWGSGTLSTPKAMVEAWMRSPAHKANLLNPAFRDLGTGIAVGSPRGGAGVTYTTDFGARS
jgi:uncharacterized protein YkwD